MNVKTLNVFYGSDFLPYKDQERSVHYPVVGSDFQGANDITEIHFYIDRVCGVNTTFAVAIKLPNGKLGSKILSPATFDSALNENYVTLPISQFITQMVGGVTISLKAYQGDIELEYDDETQLYSIPNNTPIIASTGIIKLNVNYATALDEGDLDEEIDIQALLGLLATKLNIVDGIIALGNISTANLSGYENGQLFYDKYTDTYYKKVATSPYYEKVNGTGVLGAPHILCRLRESNATIEQALSLYGNSMFVYEVSGKDYLFLATDQISGSTAVAFGIETRKTYIRTGMQDSDTLDSVVSSTYEADLDLGNRYVKTAGVKIGDIYHTIELVGGDMVIGSGSGDIWLQPNGTSKYITSSGDGDANKVEQYEVANADFVLDQCLDITSKATLYEIELAYASRPNSVLKFSDLIYRHAYEDSDYIYFKCSNDEAYTNFSTYDTYALGSTIRIRKSNGTIDRGYISFDFYNKTQSEGKFATNFTASLDTTTYVLTFTLKNANGSTLATQTIDLPLESIVTSMTYYDEYTYGGTTYHNVLVIVLATTSVPTIVPVGSLISGLEHEALVEVSDISTPLTASQLALLEYPNAMITYGNDVYLKAEDNGTYITLSVPYISLTTNSGHEEATRKFIVVTKSSGAMALTSDTTSFYNKSQADTLLGEKADASSVVEDSDIETLGGAVTRIRKGNTWNEVAQEVNMSTTPKVVQSVADLPADNDGYLYVVLDNGYLYSWDEENQEWAQQYQYTSDLLTITEVAVGDDDYSYITDKTNNNRPIQVESAKKDANGDVIDETYAKVSDLETIDERLDNHDTDIAKLKKDVDYAMKYPLLYGTPTTDTEEEVGLMTSQLPATTLPKGLINYVGGMSQKVNNLVKNGNFENTNNWDVNSPTNGSISASNNVLTYTSIVKNTSNSVLQTGVAMTNGHKYLFVGTLISNVNTSDTRVALYKGSLLSIKTFNIVANTKYNVAEIYTYNLTSGNADLYAYCDTTNGLEAGNTLSLSNFANVDLTDIYGAGNEPTSTDDYRIKWLIHYLTENPDYDEGSIVNAPVEKIVSKGFNIWDEEWENGVYSYYSGGKVDNANYLRNKNPIKVLPNTSYFFKNNGNDYMVLFYDKNNSYLGYYSGALFTTPANCCYICFYCNGTTYNHDICINLSGTMNGTYLLYQAPSNYPIPAEVQALDGYGLGYNDTLYNYTDFESKKFVKKVRIVNLSSLDWQMNTDVSGGFSVTSASMQTLGIKYGLCKLLCSKYNAYSGSFAWTSFDSIPNNVVGKNDSNYALYVKDTSYNDLTTFKNSLSSSYLVYELDEPVETDISEYLDRDFPNENLIDTYQGGEVEFENDNDMGVPYSFTYQYKVE